VSHFAGFDWSVEFDTEILPETAYENPFFGFTCSCCILRVELLGAKCAREHSAT
jgi:hypothetical protein